MTTIILVSIGILLAAVASLFVIFYGGDAFNGGDAKAQAVTLENAGLNVESAQTGYVAANGSYADSLTLLEGTSDYSWLKNDPQIQKATSAKQAISTANGTLAYAVGGVSEVVCRRVNFDYGKKDARTADLATSMTVAVRGCYKSGADNIYYVRFDGANGGSLVSTPESSALATSIIIHSAGYNCIHIAEVQAFAGNTNVAAAANGGVATGSTPYSPTSSPDKAIDGVFPASYPNIYHSSCGGSSDFLQVTFGQPSPVDRVAIYGRQDYDQGADVYNYQVMNGTTVLYSGTIDARSGTGSSFGSTAAVDNALAAVPGLPEPAVPVVSSPLSVYAGYMSWLTGEFKRRSTILGPDVAFAFVTQKSNQFIGAGINGAHFTGVHYADDGFYSNKGFSNPVPYFYFTLLGEDQPYASFCQEWKSVAPSPDNYCDNYYGNHITFYPNG